MKNLMVTMQLTPLDIPADEVFSQDDLSKFQAARPLPSEDSYLK
jgi:hypothetical protein